jgi:DnaK suppressor protein
MATKPSKTAKTPIATKSAAKPAAKPATAAQKPAAKVAAKAEPQTKTAVPAKPAPKSTKPVAAASTMQSKPKAQDAKPAKAAPAAKSAASPVKAVKSTETPAAQTHKWAEIRKILLGMKDLTLREIARSIKSGSELHVGEEPTGDIYDQASTERDRELGLLLNDREREKLHNIDEALLRIDEGDYGICEECDEDIPLGRLKVLPFTRHCVKCKSDIERLQAQTRRIEEERAYREIPLGDEEDG